MQWRSIARLARKTRATPHGSTTLPSLANTGDLEGAVANMRKALTLDPSDAAAESDLGSLLFEHGQAKEGYEHLKKAIAMAPNFPDAHNRLGLELIKTGRLDEAESELQKAVELSPESEEYRDQLGVRTGIKGEVRGSGDKSAKAVELSEGKDWKALDMLAHAYNSAGRFSEAEQSERKALELVVAQHDQNLEKNLRENLEHSTSSKTARGTDGSGRIRERLGAVRRSSEV